MAHAPGFIFRHAGEVEGLGANPTALEAVAYAIGVVWARTKNLLAVIVIHAAMDLFPNVSEFIATWRI